MQSEISSDWYYYATLLVIFVIPGGCARTRNELRKYIRENFGHLRLIRRVWNNSSCQTLIVNKKESTLSPNPAIYRGSRSPAPPRNAESLSSRRSPSSPSPHWLTTPSACRKHLFLCVLSEINLATWLIVIVATHSFRNRRENPWKSGKCEMRVLYYFISISKINLKCHIL